MRKKLIRVLSCPNNHQSDFKIFGAEVIREGSMLSNLADEGIQDEDDVKNGLLICESSKTAYPISEFIAILLNDQDIDHNHHQSLLEKYVNKCPEPYHSILLSTLQRIKQTSETHFGKWNREEMRYYDKEVSTDDQRALMLSSIKNVPIWRIFIPRSKHIINYISKSCANKLILEIGSGNSRTVSWAFNPSKFNYNYVGSDISYKRLLVAKSAIPAGDFFQASALNLPFKKESFDTLISFGMLHHLPAPLDAIKSCLPLIKPGGYMAFHEPIIKPEVKLPGLKTFKKIMNTYEHSEHDGKIDLQSSLDILKSNNFSTVHLTKKISTVRAFSETTIKKISKKILLKKWAINLIEGSDELILNTLSKISKKAAPSTVYAVFKKTDS